MRTPNHYSGVADDAIGATSAASLERRDAAGVIAGMSAEDIMPSSYEQNQDERPGQKQERQPGREHQMHPAPIYIRDDYRGADKLKGKVALITGGDSGIGRSVAVHFAREGARIAIVYLEEDADAEETKRLIEAEHSECLLCKGDVTDSSFCERAVEDVRSRFGRLDILVNNAAEQHETHDLTEISDEQLRRTFETNIFGYFYFVRAAVPLLRNGGVIINSTSITAYRGSSHLIDYASTKGAIVAFTRSLATYLVDQGIRVNGVAPGPIWTPLIPATFPEDMVESFGKDTPLGRAGQPAEVAPSYVFLAAEDSSYMLGQVLHVDGGSFTSS
jgi:NAD(P)-dependent dehydrogenase (short-subunit alcohol dehydrogenase family)